MMFNLSGIFEKMKNKKVQSAFIWVAAGIIVLIILGSFGGNKKETEGSTAAGFSPPFFREDEDYIKNLEKQTASILSGIKGAGKVSVMITMHSGSEKVLAKDSKQNEQRSMDGTLESEKNSAQFERDDKIVVSGRQSSSEAPIVTKQVMPKIWGVLVVAEGAGDNAVKEELYSAVRSLLGAPAHRIQVAAGKK